MLPQDRRPRLLAALSAAAALCTGLPALAAEITDVRVGEHPKFTRVVFELDGRAGYRVERAGTDAAPELRITIEATSSARELRAVGDVRGVKVDAGTKARAHIALRDAGLRVQEMMLSDPPRIVVDLLKPETAVAATAKPEPARPKTEAREAPKVEPRPEIKPGPKETAKAEPPKQTAKAEPKETPETEARPAPPAPPKEMPAPATAPKVEPPVRPAPAPKTAAAPTAPPAQPKQATPVPAPPGPGPQPALIPAPRVAPPPSAAQADKPLPQPAIEPPKPTPPDAAHAAVPPAPAPTPIAPPAVTPPPPPPAPTPDSVAKAPPPAPIPPAPSPVRPVPTPMPAPHAAPAPPPAPSASWSDRLKSYPIWIGGAIAAGLLSLAAIAIAQRRRRALPNDLDVTAIAEEIEQTSESPGRIPSGGFAMGDDDRTNAPAKESPLAGLFDRPVAPVAPPRQEVPEAPVAAQEIAAAESAAEDSLFDDAGETSGEPDVREGDAPMDQEMDLPVERRTAQPAARMGGSAAPSTSPDLMRMLQDMERRIATLEARLDESNEAREKLERQVAAQSEELRVQRAAIARTQRALRTMTRGEEDRATEPALRDGETQAKTRVTP